MFLKNLIKILPVGSARIYALTFAGMVRLSVVSYLNTTPFLYGIKHSGFLNSADYELSLDNPASCADKLLSGKADIGLIPVAVLPLLSHYNIIGNTCIGANGKVDSVLLMSEVPLNRIKTIYLDYQSRTSVNLCRILASKLWKIDVEFVNAPEDFLDHISGNTAAVVIGDRALDLREKFPFTYDLSEGWKDLTGLPFVFAAWVSVNNTGAEYAPRLEAALQWGIDHSREAAKAISGSYPLHYHVDTYLTQRISYTLDEAKRKALETFLFMLSKLTDSGN